MHQAEMEVYTKPGIHVCLHNKRLDNGISHERRSVAVVHTHSAANSCVSNNRRAERKLEYFLASLDNNDTQNLQKN